MKSKPNLILIIKLKIIILKILKKIIINIFIIILVKLILILIIIIFKLISINIENNNNNHYYINDNINKINYDYYDNNITYLNKREIFSPNLKNFNEQSNRKTLNKRLKNKELKQKIGNFSELFDEFNFWVENVRNKIPNNTEINKLKKKLKNEKKKNKKLYHENEILIKKIEELENENKRLKASIIAREDFIR